MCVCACVCVWSKESAVKFPADEVPAYLSPTLVAQISPSACFTPKRMCADLHTRVYIIRTAHMGCFMHYIVCVVVCTGSSTMCVHMYIYWLGLQLELNSVVCCVVGFCCQW